MENGRYGSEKMKQPKKLEVFMSIETRAGTPVLLIPTWLASAYRLKHGYLKVVVDKGFYGGHTVKERQRKQKKVSEYWNWCKKRKIGAKEKARIEKAEEMFWENYWNKVEKNEN